MKVMLKQKKKEKMGNKWNNMIMDKIKEIKF